MDDQTIQKTDGIKEQNPLIQDRTVVALFDGEDGARQAEQALIEAGYDKVVVTSNDGDAKVDDATGEPKAVHDHGFWEGVKAFFGGHEDAHLYGEGLRRGQTLVTVHTEQGRAANAVDILDRFNPTDVEGAEQAWHSDDEGQTGPTAMDDLPAEDRPAYLAASADAEPVTAIIAVVDMPQSSVRDPDIGNARVRSYVPRGDDRLAGEVDDVALRDTDSILSDTDEDRLVGDETEANATDMPNKAWTDRTHGLEDGGLEGHSKTGAANDSDITPKT